MRLLPFIAAIEERDPEFFRVTKELQELIFKESSLDQKTKLLISLAVDACEGSAQGVASVARALRGLGVTDQQIAEVLRITYFAKGNSTLGVSMAAFDEKPRVE